MYLISVLSLMLGFLLGGTGEAFAQATKTVSGTVSDEKGEPIISGTVMVKTQKLPPLPTLTVTLRLTLPPTVHSFSRTSATSHKKFLLHKLRAAFLTYR